MQPPDDRYSFVLLSMDNETMKLSTIFDNNQKWAAEKLGHSEDVCTYVKCDVGMMKSGNVGPTGERLPDPDLLLLSYTGCFTFMKWFEILREEYDCPVAMLHVPYQGDGEITAAMRGYVVDQLRGHRQRAAARAGPGP